MFYSTVGYVFLCIYSFPREFVERQFTELPYQVCVGTFQQIQQERVPFQPTTHVDKMIIAYLPVDGGTAWEQLQRVPLRDMLVFADTFPGFYLEAPRIPAYFMPPPTSPPPPNAFWGQPGGTTPPPPPTPQYTPASPDTPYSPGGLTTFPPYYSPFSPGLITYPPTPNLPPPCTTPNAPPRLNPPRRRLLEDDTSSSDEELRNLRFVCDDCRRNRGRELGRGIFQYA